MESNSGWVIREGLSGKVIFEQRLEVGSGPWEHLGGKCPRQREQAYGIAWRLYSWNGVSSGPGVGLSLRTEGLWLGFTQNRVKAFGRMETDCGAESWLLWKLNEIIFYYSLRTETNPQKMINKCHLSQKINLFFVLALSVSGVEHLFALYRHHIVMMLAISPCYGFFLRKLLLMTALYDSEECP